MSAQAVHVLNTADVASLLDRASGGDKAALNTLLPLVYSELHERAKRYLKQERNAHTLQPTALINEVVARLLGGSALTRWGSRAEFVAVLARGMRQVLVDTARRHNAAKRPHRADQVDLDSVDIAVDDNLVSVDESLQRLAEIHPRQARVVELKYFGGLTLDEIADVLHSSEATVTRDWRLARAWLQRDIVEA